MLLNDLQLARLEQLRRSFTKTCQCLVAGKVEWLPPRSAFPFGARSNGGVGSAAAVDWSTLEACRCDVMHRRQWSLAETAGACDLVFFLAVVCTFPHEN